MSKQAAKKTLAAFKQSIIDTLDMASGGDENMEHMHEVCNDLLGTVHEIDLSATDPMAVYLDPKVQAAFRKFINGQFGTMQQFEAEFSPDNDNQG